MFEDLIPELQDFARELVDAAARAGLQPRVTSTRRSHAAQQKLYAKFLAGGSPYPALPPGQSAHEFGYAFDLITSPMDALADVGYTWQQWGGLWGGNRDPVHFEYPGFVPPPSTGVGTETTYTKVAGTAVEFALPPALSIAAALSPDPTFVKGKPISEWTWQDWLDPQCFFHAC